MNESNGFSLTVREGVAFTADVRHGNARSRDRRGAPLRPRRQVNGRDHAARAPAAKLNGREFKRHESRVAAQFFTLVFGQCSIRRDWKAPAVSLHPYRVVQWHCRRSSRSDLPITQRSLFRSSPSARAPVAARLCSESSPANHRKGRADAHHHVGMIDRLTIGADAGESDRLVAEILGKALDHLWIGPI